jgi:hypothetical protein
MAARQVAAFSAVLTVGGTSTGYVTIAPFDVTKGPFIGADVWLQSSAAGPLEYKVTSSNPVTGLIGLQAKTAANGGVVYGNTNVSAFTVANAATIYMTQQLDSTGLSVTGSNSSSVDVSGNLVTSDSNIKKLNGQDAWLGSIVAATAGTQIDNATTGTAFALTGTETVMLQSNVAVYMQVIAAASYTAGGARAVMLEANEKYVFTLNGGTKITIDPVVTGATTVKVFTKS